MTHFAHYEEDEQQQDGAVPIQGDEAGTTLPGSGSRI